MKNVNIKKRSAILLGIACAAISILLCSCSGIGESIDPSQMGYPHKVVYNALGGNINQYEIRTVYYADNSYIFKPSGTSDMLVEPKREGYTLVGWYTAKEDVLDADGNVIDYKFKAEDRFDFDEDHITGDINLYARWIPQASLQYVNADTDEVFMTKDVTVDSPVQPLSDAVAGLYTPDGKSLFQYYFDKECTQVCDFSVIDFEEPLINNEDIYARLSEELPQYVAKLEEGEEADLSEGNPYRYISAAGYKLLTTDEAALKEIRAKKDEIIEHSIESYIEGSSLDRLYMKFIDGNYVRISSADELLNGKTYSFGNLSGTDIDGYIFTADIDFEGGEISPLNSFSGKIYGNGHTLSNFKISAYNRKIVNDGSSYGLFGEMKDSVIENLNFKNADVEINSASAGSMYVGLIAGKAENTVVSGCGFENVTVKTLAGGSAAPYESANGGTCYAGDLFGSGTGNTVKDFRMEGDNPFDIDVTGNVEVNSLLLAQNM